MGSRVGTNTLEKKNKDLNKATKELEAKMKNLQQKTRSLPNVSGAPSTVTTTGSGSVSRSGSRGAGRLRELPSTPSTKEESGGEGEDFEKVRGHPSRLVC